MKAMILGDSGKEHALATALARDPSVENIYVLPGNAALALNAKVQLLSIDASDARSIIHQAQDLKVDLIILGHPAAMAAGIGDVLRGAGLIVLGPSQAAAQIGRDALFTTQFLQQQGILDLTMPGIRQTTCFTATTLCDASSFKLLGITGDYQFVRWRERDAFLAYNRDDFADAPPLSVLQDLVQDRILRGLRQRGIIFNGMLSLKLQAWQGQWGVRQIQTWPQARELQLALPRLAGAFGQYFAAAATNLLAPLPDFTVTAPVSAHLAVVVDQNVLAKLYQRYHQLEKEGIYLAFSGHKPDLGEPRPAGRMIDLVALGPNSEVAQQKLHQLFNEFYLESVANASSLS